MQRVASGGLLTQVELSDERAFTDLLVPLVQPAYRLACAMLHDSETAKDVVQDASLIAWRKLALLRDRSRMSAWFLTIVANECRNARRRKWISAVSVGLSSRLHVASAEDSLVSRADLRRALMNLGHRDRLIVSLYFYLDLPFEEIAEIAGCSAGAARVRLHRSVRRLRPEVALEEALQ